MSLSASPAWAQAPDSAATLAMATLPLPPQLRGGASVVQLGPHGHPNTLRAGTNPMVCFADNPADTLLDVRCYHAAFVPLIYAARRLGRTSLADSTLNARILEEIQAGRLTLPSHPTAGYRVLGPMRSYNPTTRELGPDIDRWQSLHMPFATTGTVGISNEEHGAEPFMMAEGTWWAHVMIMQAPLRY